MKWSRLYDLSAALYWEYFTALFLDAQRKGMVIIMYDFLNIDNNDTQIHNDVKKFWSKHGSQ